MATNRDFRDLFCELNRGSVRYLVVGGYAVAFHGRPRYTKDLDVWVDPDPANATRVWAALAAFGAPLREVPPAGFATPGRVFQIGVAPDRIDIINRIDGVEFPEAAFDGQ